jgi:LPS O-antigen subunit length determinant protein (WzzB/FepE family)
LSRKIVRTSDDIDDFKHDNAQMERWLLALRQQNERVKQKDDIRIQHLQEELSANRKEINDAQKNNAALREVLHELRSLLLLGEKANAA